MSNDEDLPKATLVQQGKITGAAPAPRPSQPAKSGRGPVIIAQIAAVLLFGGVIAAFKYRGYYTGVTALGGYIAIVILLWRFTHRGRRLTNFLLDKRLQLRYLMMVTVLSAVIAGSLGALIYTQQHDASDDVVAGIAGMADPDATPEENEEFVAGIKADMARKDRDLIKKMAVAGIGMAVILSLYLLVMTHKVAGPLFKCALYFDKMKLGKLGKVTALRKGDMLGDFYDGFREMHEAVRGRQVADNAAMRKFLDACAAAGVERAGALGDELDELDKHVTERKKNLVDFPA